MTSGIINKTESVSLLSLLRSCYFVIMFRIFVLFYIHMHEDFCFNYFFISQITKFKNFVTDPRWSCLHKMSSTKMLFDLMFGFQKLLHSFWIISEFIFELLVGEQKFDVVEGRQLQLVTLVFLCKTQNCECIGVVD